MSRTRSRRTSGNARRIIIGLALGLLAGTIFFFGKRAWSQYRTEAPAGVVAGADFFSGGTADDVDLFAPLRDDMARRTAHPRAKRGKRAADAFPHLKLASEHLLVERYADAFREYARASEMAPDDPRPFYGLGEVYRGLDRNELAVRAYRRALELDASFLGAKRNLARVLCLLGQNEEAVTLLRDVARRAPHDTAVIAQLAKNMMRLGSPAKAIALLKKYNSAVGRQNWGYANLGRAYAEAGQPDEAERWYRSALAIDQRAMLTHLWLGQLLVAQGRRSEAETNLGTFRQLQSLRTQERKLERMLLRRPDNLNALANLALARHLLGKNQKALIPLERALTLKPDEPKLLELKTKVTQAIAGASPRP